MLHEIEKKTMNEPGLSGAISSLIKAYNGRASFTNDFPDTLWKATLAVISFISCSNTREKKELLNGFFHSP